MKNQPSKQCEASPTDLFCVINDLLPAMEYTVQTTACLDESSGPDQCSNFWVEGKGWTKPSRKTFIDFSYYKNI